MKKYCYIIILFFVFTVAGFGQKSVESVRKLKEKTLQEIEYANKILEETRGKTKQSLHEVNIINSKLKKRKEYIISLEAEAAMVDNNLRDCENDIKKLESNILRLKEIYASILIQNYKRRLKNYYLIFFLASENMNQLYQRFRFVKIYMNYLRLQRVNYERLRLELAEKAGKLKEIKGEKEILVNTTRKEYSIIKDESVRKMQLLKSLTRKEGNIEKEIRDKKRTMERLDREITKLIESEKVKTGSGKSGLALTPVEQIISTDFGKNQGRLPWPTQKGMVTGKYGEHEHPDYKSVKIRNDGIYISTQNGEYVRAVFKGVVSKVFSIPGENFTVIIKHGNYYTLYHNLVDVTVKAGQHVETKEVIGKVFTDADTKETTLYFQLWKETERNDPELWLAP